MNRNPDRILIPARLIFLLFCLQSYCYAQEKAKVEFGKLNPSDFVIPSSVPVDSSTSAVALADIGSIKFVGNKQGWFSNVFRRHTRIKILDKRALNLATVEISLYKNNEDIEAADNILASTYNLENGKIVETKLDKKDIFDEAEDKHHLNKKFTLPNVRPGSIIEFTYTITSPYNVTLPTWQFQSMQYPCLWSQLDVAIPQTLTYVTVRQGVHPYAVNKGSEGSESYKITRKSEMGLAANFQDDQIVTANTIKHQWAMKDIPPFRPESYLTTPKNYIDRLDFQLEKTFDGRDSHDFMNSWKQATQDLLHDENFGQPISEDNEWLDEPLSKITSGKNDDLERAKAIYYFVSGHYTCTNHYDKYIRTNLRDVYRKNSGSVGDLNMLLIAMLRKSYFTADPVLLSTRDFGVNLSKYPILSRLNYVIARVKVNGKIYYLDVAHPQLGFGQLSGDCYNGHARIISLKDSASVYFEADSLIEKKSTVVFISYGKDGMEGTFQSVLGQQESYNTRERVTKIGVQEYFKNIQTGYGEDMDLQNTNIDSLTQPEQPIAVRYEFNMRQNHDASILYFNPMMSESWHENPFKAAERTYPVEMPYATDELYMMNMEIPDGYTVDEMPKSARVAYNGDQGSFEYLVAKQDNLIQLRCRLKLNHANFAAEDYASLRDFIGFVVKKESEQIVLKKK